MLFYTTIKNIRIQFERIIAGMKTSDILAILFFIFLAALVYFFPFGACGWCGIDIAGSCSADLRVCFSENRVILYDN